MKQDNLCKNENVTISQSEEEPSQIIVLVSYGTSNDQNILLESSLQGEIARLSKSSQQAVHQTFSSNDSQDPPDSEGKSTCLMRASQFDKCFPRQNRDSKQADCETVSPDHSHGIPPNSVGKSTRQNEVSSCESSSKIKSELALDEPSHSNDEVSFNMKNESDVEEGSNSNNDVTNTFVEHQNSVDTVESTIVLYPDCQVSDEELSSKDSDTVDMPSVTELIHGNQKTLENESTTNAQNTMHHAKNKTPSIRHKRKKNVKQSKENRSTDGKFICDICGNIFMKLDTLKTHILKHKGRTFDCELCPKRYKAKEDLKRHIAVKHQQKRYVCTICDKSFLSPSGLLRHKKEHEEQYKFTCAVCSRSFNYKSHFDSHMAAHNNVQPHKCERCGKSYVYSSSLAHHRANCGDREKSFWCQICEKGFIHKAYLRRHMSVHMDNQVQCSNCGCFFANKHTLTKHLERKHSGNDNDVKYKRKRKKQQLVEQLPITVPVWVQEIVAVCNQ